MRFLIPFLLVVNLYGAGFWTLTGLTQANIYIQNELGFLNEKTVPAIKTKINAMFKETNIATNQQDAPTLMISLQGIDNDDEQYVYVKLSIGEEVQTFREDKSATFALTYDSSDFIETDSEEIDKDILESVDFLLAQFAEQYEDDKE